MHAQTCAGCSTRLAELEATVRLCRGAGAEALPEGFSLELRRRLVADGPPARSWLDRIREWIATWPLASMAGAAALAAILAVLFVRGGTFLRGGTPTLQAQSARGEAPLHRVPMSRIALVKVDFVADAPVEEVQFEVLLPDGLRFYSGGHELAERSFQWKGALQAGSNAIPIAVKGERPGRYRLVAHATGASLDVLHEVVLEVTT
jgi:hypothetical protein